MTTATQTVEERMERRRREEHGSREERSHWNPTDWETVDAADEVADTAADPVDWEAVDASDDVLEHDGTCRRCDAPLTPYNRAQTAATLCEVCDHYAGRADNPRLTY